MALPEYGEIKKIGHERSDRSSKSYFDLVPSTPTAATRRGLQDDLRTDIMRSDEPMPYKKRNPWRFGKGQCAGSMTVAFYLGFMLLLQTVSAVMIDYQNCLPPSVIDSTPRQLQWVPLGFDAKFIHLAATNLLNITVYGNVTGQATQGPYPPPNDPSWNNPNSTFGKIVDFLPNENFTTLFSTFDVATFTAFKSPPSEFCLSTVNVSCPIAPAFGVQPADTHSLPAFTVSHQFSSSYSFASIDATIRTVSGSKGAPDLACISGVVTPDLGRPLTAALRFIPAGVLAFVALATVSAAIWSPWGSADPYRWTSNYGRDQDLLRLITPGFGDCLQYIQFIVLAGSLSLEYPGFYQPVVSTASWSTLMLNESFVSHSSGYQSLVDGVYTTDSDHGIGRLSQLVGMGSVVDIWAGMATILTILVLGMVIVCQLGFAIRWGYQTATNTTEQDLRSKNLPFTLGNIVRIIYNYFLQPIVAFSFFQLVIASKTAAIVVAMDVILLVALGIIGVWIFHVIFATRPRARLFDDLPTLLLYGPLYNTYSDEAAPFAFIPVFLTFVRGLAIGAVQPSGIAQIVLLAICEVVFLLTVHAFRPFQSLTSMNAYHTFFAIVRLVTVLLSIAFVPSLGVTEAPKTWLGYIILLLHALVLIFGFFLNALQTLIEVGARLVGIGGDGNAAKRGGLTKVFGMRQLSKRHERARGSLNSEAQLVALTEDHEQKSVGDGGSRSLSISSQMMLNQQYQGHQLGGSGVYEPISLQGSGALLSTQRSSDTTLANASVQNRLNPGPSGSMTPGSTMMSGKRPILGIQTDPANVDPYYRHPRKRRPTTETVTPGARSRSSQGVAWSDRSGDDSADDDAGSVARERGGPITAYLRRRERAESSPTPHDERRPKQDYTTREVDFYYGVRGPALSTQPSRKLKTGPADPINLVSTASGWVKGLFNSKTKESSKGFEVIRSTKAPIQRMTMLSSEGDPADEEDNATTPTAFSFQETYRDSAGPQTDATPSTNLSTSPSVYTSPHPDPGPSTRAPSHPRSSASHPPDPNRASTHSDPFDLDLHRISEFAPLGPLEGQSGIELLSRPSAPLLTEETSYDSFRATSPPTIPGPSNATTAVAATPPSATHPHPARRYPTPIQPPSASTPSPRVPFASPTRSTPHARTPSPQDRSPDPIINRVRDSYQSSDATHASPRPPTTTPPMPMPAPLNPRPRDWDRYREQARDVGRDEDRDALPRTSSPHPRSVHLSLASGSPSTPLSLAASASAFARKSHDPDPEPARAAHAPDPLGLGVSGARGEEEYEDYEDEGDEDDEYDDDDDDDHPPEGSTSPRSFGRHRRRRRRRRPVSRFVNQGRASYALSDVASVEAGLDRVGSSETAFTRGSNDG